MLTVMGKKYLQFYDEKICLSKPLIKVIHYCMVCAFVREDEPQALEWIINHTGRKNIITAYCTMHLHFVHCKIFDVKHQ